MADKHYKESILERNERLGVDAKVASFIVKQKQSYEFKVRYAEIRAVEFLNECAKRELDVHVSVGGLDSITLLLFLRSIGIWMNKMGWGDVLDYIGVGWRQEDICEL